MKNRVKVSLIIIMIIAASLVAVVFSACNKKAKTYTVVYIAGEHGTIYGEIEQSIESGKSSQTITAVPDTGYCFIKWSDGLSVAQRTDINVTEDINVTAIFGKRAYTVSYTVMEGGTISGNADQAVVYGGFSQQVTAVANTGYRFVKWSDGNTNATRLETDVVNNLYLTAEFEKITYTVLYTATEGGIIQGNTQQTIEHGSNATMVTAISYDGYEFVKWSDGLQTATRTDENIISSLNIKAEFKVPTHLVVYKSNYFRYGLLKEDNAKDSVYELSYQISHGEEAPPVCAYPEQSYYKESYVFLYWSDGVTTEERHDTNITEDMTLTAYFGYTINYVVNNNIGGKIEGKTNQKLLSNEFSTEVTAVPNEGYVFCGWSDYSFDYNRPGDNNKEYLYLYAYWEYIAYFEPIEKTFRYNYGIANGNSYAKEITLNRNGINNAKFIVPECEGYTFCGWYADSDYRIRITDANGKYMYGYAAFSLETDTLYARWEKQGEETDNHKILIVYVDEVNAELYSTKVEKTVDASSKMTPIDYEMSKWVTETIRNLLNEWFNGEIVFEVDAYYTTVVVENGFSSGSLSSGDFSYCLNAPDISEVAVIAYSYHNTLTTVSFGENTKNLFLSAGDAGMKNASINRSEWIYYTARQQYYLEYLKTDNIDLEKTVVETYIHEFVHTAEMYFNREYELHDILRQSSDVNGMNIYRQFLLGEYVIDGKTYGVPMEYWKHQIPISLICYIQKGGGKTKLSEEPILPSDYIYGWNMYRFVNYGEEITIEAVPNEGYHFVKWSDGVTSPIRHEKIIAHFRVNVIFEKD